jgi:NADH:ubiquinone oxidoreductase subunit E
MPVTAQEVLDRWSHKRECLIEMLHDVQSEYNYLPREILEEVSGDLKVSLPKILEIASFYNAFSLKLKGTAKYNMAMCNGTLCYVKQAPLIIEQFEEELKIKVGEVTDDKLFGLETAACLGICGLAPVMIINGEEVIARLTQERVPKLIEELRGRAEAEKHQPKERDD